MPNEREPLGRRQTSAKSAQQNKPFQDCSTENREAEWKIFSVFSVLPLSVGLVCYSFLCVFVPLCENF
jgi:hypothetical protein